MMQAFQLLNPVVSEYNLTPDKYFSIKSILISFPYSSDPVGNITDADSIDDLILLANTPTQLESLLYNPK